MLYVNLTKTKFTSHWKTNILTDWHTENVNVILHNNWVLDVTHFLNILNCNKLPYLLPQICFIDFIAEQESFHLACRCSTSSTPSDVLNVWVCLREAAVRACDFTLCSGHFRNTRCSSQLMEHNARLWVSKAARILQRPDLFDLINSKCYF